MRLKGKTQDEAINALGKPDYLLACGGLMDGRTYDEGWDYENAVRHKATGMKQELKVITRIGEVLAWNTI